MGWLWHRRLAHVGMKNVHKLLKGEHILGLRNVHMLGMRKPLPNLGMS
jgi:hypothetical protein